MTECPICLDEFPPYLILNCCNLPCCLSCLLTNICSSQCLKCPHGKSIEPDLPFVDRAMVPSEMWDIISKIMTIQIYTTLQCYQCGNLFHLTDNEIPEKGEQCKLCNHCMQCGAPNKQRCVCLRALSKYNQMADDATKLSVTPCPCCKRSVFRDGGCNHMVCNSCKTEFCFVCGERTHGSDHYRKQCNGDRKKSSSSKITENVTLINQQMQDIINADAKDTKSKAYTKPKVDAKGKGKATCSICKNIGHNKRSCHMKR